MSRSLRKNPIHPWMRDKTDKHNKREANRKLRMAVAENLRRYMRDGTVEAHVFPLVHQVSDVRGFHPRDVSKLEGDPIEAVIGRRK